MQLIMSCLVFQCGAARFYDSREMSSFIFDKFSWSGDQNDRPHRVGLEVEGSVLNVATRKGLHQGNQLAAADPIVGNPPGKHVWQVRVLDSFHNWGDGLVIGAMDGQAKLNEPEGTKAWGLHVFSGCVHSTTNATNPGAKGKQVCEPLSGAAKDARIRVMADLGRKSTLSFAVNGGEWVDSGVVSTV